MTQEDKNTTKCYCGHTTYCDCSPLVNKQTAVKWLLQRFEDGDMYNVEDAIYKNGYLHGYNAATAELPKELSDEEIMEYATKNAFQYYEFVSGAKWYREQLRLKANNNT